MMFSARRALPSLGVTTKRIFPIHEFLVGKDLLQDLASGQCFGQFCREIESPDHTHQFFDFLFLQTGSFCGDLGRRNHPQGDCLSVQERPVTGDRFDRVAERVAEVQQRAASGGFSFVFLDERGFDLDAPPDQIGKVPLAIS